MMYSYSIAIDLGGTVVKIGLAHRGKIVRYIALDSQLSLGLEPNLSRIREGVETLLQQEKITASCLEGVGLAFPGLVDPKNNRIISTNEKYDDAPTLELPRWVKENWDVPLYMDNDARLAVLGEWVYGSAKGRNNVVMMTIGTGIGTGVILDGRLVYGTHFQAGSLGGHFTVDYRGRRCTCGNKGCVEALASSFFLPVIIREHPQLSETFKQQAETFDFKQLFHLAAEGDREALLVRNECMDVWSAAVITYIHAYDPEIILLGGGVMNSGKVILPYIREKVDRYAWCPSEKVKICSSGLSEQAALLGLAYRLAQTSRHHTYLYDPALRIFGSENRSHI